MFNVHVSYVCNICCINIHMKSRNPPANFQKINQLINLLFLVYGSSSADPSGRRIVLYGSSSTRLYTINYVNNISKQ